MTEIGEEDLENCGLKVNANELLAFQRDLKQEKELLQKILVKIDDQVHRLQVEQLNLLGIMNKSLKGTKERSPKHESTSDNQENTTNKFLDLSVASAFDYFKEEVEDEDDDD
ncbi:PREDICTED: uncharacterized protein LOC108574662, partial [Habropoda laboriosa]